MIELVIPKTRTVDNALNNSIPVLVRTSIELEQGLVKELKRIKKKKE